MDSAGRLLCIVRDAPNGAIAFLLAGTGRVVDAARCCGRAAAVLPTSFGDRTRRLCRGTFPTLAYRHLVPNPFRSSQQKEPIVNSEQLILVVVLSALTTTSHMPRRLQIEERAGKGLQESQIELIRTCPLSSKLPPTTYHW